MKIRITHTVVLTVEEHTPEHERLDRALSTFYGAYTRHRHMGDVVYRLDANDLDEVEAIRKAVAA